MHAAQKLVAAILTIGLFMSSMSVSFADKGGKHDDKNKGGAPGQSAGPQQGPGLQGPGKTPSQGPPSSSSSSKSSDRNSSSASSSGGLFGAPPTEFEGDVDGLKSGQVIIKVGKGMRAFAATAPVISALEKIKGKGTLVFFTTGGNEITAVATLGELVKMRVTGQNGTTFMLQGADGQSRLITLDAKTRARLGVRVGSNLGLIAKSASIGRVIAFDRTKGPDVDQFAKFSSRSKFDNDVDNDVAKLDIDLAKTKKTDVDLAKVDQDFAKVDIDIAKAKKTKADIDVRRADNDIAKLDIDVSKVKKAKKADVDVQKLDVDVAKLDVDVHKERKAKADVDVAKADVDQGGGKCGPSHGRNGNPAFANQMAKDAANDASGHNPPGLPHECVNPAGHTRGFCKSESSSGICGSAGVSGGESSATEVASAHGKARAHKNAGGEAEVAAAGNCAHGKSRNGNPAFANQMAKDAANDASGHNPPGLPHECVNPAGHTRGFCKSESSSGVCGSSSGGGENQVASAQNNGCPPGTESSRRGNPAFANQMAKDQANDISGHNPPGLPHECVNPAGHTRGFCKSHSKSTAGICNAAVGSGSNAAVATTTAPGTTTSAVTRNRSRGESTATRGPGTLGGAIPLPVGFNTQFPTAVATRSGGAAGAPTHVLGAAVGPNGKPTRVLPVAIQPVGKRRCVWYKTAVLAASTGPYRIIGTSALSSKPKLRKKCH